MVLVEVQLDSDFAHSYSADCGPAHPLEGKGRQLLLGEAWGYLARDILMPYVFRDRLGKGAGTPCATLGGCNAD